MGRRRVAVMLVSATVVGSGTFLGMPASAATVTQEDVDVVAAARTQAEAALAVAEARLARATTDRDRYTQSLARIAARQRQVADESVETAETVRDRVARIYMTAGASTVGVAVEDVTRFTTRIAYLGAIADTDQQAVVDLTFSAVDLAGLENDARRQLALHEDRVIDETASVVARTADADEARLRYSSTVEEWQRQEAARRAALEAEMRAQEAALQASVTTTTTTVVGVTTPPPQTYDWSPQGGVEQWRALVTRVFGEWGLDQEKCGPAGCVGPQIENALVIMRCESSGIPFATAGPDNEWGVIGLYQHRLAYWSERVARARSRGFSSLPADATPWNPEHNVIVAALLVWESRETIIGNLSYGRPWSDGPQPWGHWDGSSRYCTSPPLVSP